MIQGLPLKTRFAVVTLTSVLSACTTPSLYSWGEYDKMLYSQYTDATQVANFKVGIQSHIERLESQSEIVAPGLYAELGTLYLQAGDAKSARTYYAKESVTWPESKRLMDQLISTIDSRESEI